MKMRILTAALAALLLIPMSTVTAYAGGGPEDEETVIEQVTEATAEPEETTGGIDPETDESPFTPSGTGTVVDTATDADGKVFYTITTPSENIFYLIIDRQRGTENVYFLNAVTEADLLALAEISETAVKPEPVVETPAPVESIEADPEPEPEAEKSGGMGSILLMVLILLIGGGAGWYFKIYRPKKAGVAMDDDEYTEGEAGLYDMDEANPYGDDSDNEPWPEDDGEADDDSPPWDESE